MKALAVTLALALIATNACIDKDTKKNRRETSSTVNPTNRSNDR